VTWHTAGALALSAVLSVLLVEIVLRLPFADVLAEGRATAKKALWTVRARGVSDHWKEKVMLAYSGRMFASSFRLGGLVLLVGAAAVVATVVVDRIWSGFAEFVVSARGILATVVWASVYLAARKFVAHVGLRIS